MTLALLSSIALGIGSNVSIFGFARGLTRPDFRLSSASRIVSIFEQDARSDAGPVSYEEYLRLKGHSRAFEWIDAARVSPVNVIMADQSTIASVAAVTSQFASALNLSMEKGVFISYRMWQSKFGKSDVRGEQIRIDGVTTRVSGVAPDWLEGLYRDRAVDIWVRLEEKNLHQANRQSRNFWVLARLRRDVSMAQAQNSFRPSPGASNEIIILPYSGMTPKMAEGMSRISTLFGLAAGAVFLIACANVVSFLLGRAFARSYETSVRVALGASRGQLARGLLWDSIVISVGGGALGLLLAVWTTDIVPALLFQEDAERLVFAPSLLSIVAASIACVAITVLCGLLPAFAGPSDRPETVLRREGAGPSKGTAHLRALLAIVQMTTCCMLVVSTALLMDGLRAALQTSSGHRLGDPILITVQKQPDSGDGIRYFQQVQQAVQSMASISTMAWAGQLPGSQAVWQSFRIEPPDLPVRDVTLDIARFTGNSLKLFKLPPKEGRLFGFEDQTCRVAIVNEKAAADLFDRDTVGRVIQESVGLPVEIIGVVAEKVHHADRRPTIYYNYADQPALAPGGVTHAHFRAPFPSELASAELDMNVVSQGYFHAMGLSLVAGQNFGDRSMIGECRVGVINQEAADLYFGGKAVGAAVIDDRGVRTSIIGVVQSRPLGTFQRHAEPALYFPMWQDPLRRMTLIVGARQMKRPILVGLRRRIEAVPGHGPAPVTIETLATYLTHTALAPLRITTLIIGASATTALTLSILGLFGALADAARQRRRELAIRVALGAQRWRVVYQVLREGARLAGTGALLGTLGSLAFSRFLAPVIPGVRSPAVWVWLAAPLMLALTALIAGVLPARRAAIVNPVTIMRDEN